MKYVFDNDNLEMVKQPITDEAERQLIEKYGKNWGAGDLVSILIYVEDCVIDRGYVGGFAQVKKDITRYVKDMRMIYEGDE